MFATRFLPSLLAIAALTLCPQTAALAQSALTADEAFRDGNRLTRDDLYWAALLRYSQAGEAGMDSPLLHYNTGVTHYLAGQHNRARESLTLALGEPSLRIATQYNLGLNAYALGQTDEALRWFRLVRDQDQDRRLQEYAVVAIARIRLEQEQPTDYEVLVEEREEKRDIFDLELRSSVAFGSDDNVFRSPDQVYQDLSDPAFPIVTPVPLASSYAALRLSALARVNSLPFEGFYFGYRLAGRQYIDEGHENADEYQHEISFGSDYYRKDGHKERELHSAFKVSQHHETYFDPDDGSVYLGNWRRMCRTG